MRIGVVFSALLTGLLAVTVFGLSGRVTRLEKEVASLREVASDTDRMGGIARGEIRAAEWLPRISENETAEILSEKGVIPIFSTKTSVTVLYTVRSSSGWEFWMYWMYMDFQRKDMNSVWEFVKKGKWDGGGY